MKVGDLFALSSYNKTTITAAQQEAAFHSIIMEGNSVATGAIGKALAMGCTETGETFIDRIEAETYTLDIDPETNHLRSTLSSAIQVLGEEMYSAKENLKASEAFKDDLEAFKKYLLEEEYVEYEISQILGSMALYEYLDKISYGGITKTDGSPLSFAEAMMLPTKNNNDGLVLDDAMVDILARSMTEGQIGLVGQIGLIPILQNTINAMTVYTDDDGNTVLGTTEYADEAIAYLTESDNSGNSQYDLENNPISVYLGVDRTIFHDNKTVAITDSAIREQSLTGGIGKTKDYGVNPGYIVMGTIGLVLSIGGFCSLLVGLTNKRLLTQAEIVEKYGDSFFKADSDISQYQTVITSTGKGLAIAGAVCLAVGIALTIYGFIHALKNVYVPTVTYTPIPRAIIDVKTKQNGDRLYFSYYAAKLAGTADDAYLTEEDTTKLYGDLNGLNKLDPWLCLYYARDLRLGSPMTTTILFGSSDPRSTSSQKKTFSPVHDFYNSTLDTTYSTIAAFNLNSLHWKVRATPLYLYVKRDLTVPTLAATILENSLLLTAVGSFIAGCGITFAATVIKTKRKAKKQVPADG